MCAYVIPIDMWKSEHEIKGLSESKKKSLHIYRFRSTRHFAEFWHFERSFSFSIHILFDNWVRNSLLLGSFRTSEGTKPRCSSTVTSSFIAAEACWLFPDLSWWIVEDEKCCLNPRKELVCFPTFCLKTLKDSVWFPVLLVTTAIVTVLVLQYRFRKMTALMKLGTSTAFSIFIALFSLTRSTFLNSVSKSYFLVWVKCYDVHQFVVTCTCRLPLVLQLCFLHESCLWYTQLFSQSCLSLAALN